MQDSRNIQFQFREPVEVSDVFPVVDAPVQTRLRVVLVSPRVLPVIRSHADASAVLEDRLGRGVEVDVRVGGGVGPQLLTREGQGRGAAGVHHHRAGHGPGEDGAPRDVGQMQGERSPLYLQSAPRKT